MLSSTTTFNTVSPMYKPIGFDRAYDHLIERAGDEPSGYYASLAESVAISADRRSMVFRLRPEARWHDGTPITATHVKFSFETFRTDIMASGWKTVLEWISKVEVVNASEIVVHANSDVAKQLYIIGYIPIVPARYWAARGLPGEAELGLLEPFRAQLPDEVFTREFSFARSDGMGVDRDGLSKARNLLAEAGWRVTDGVLVNSAGEPFDLEFLATSPQNQRTLLPYARALSVLGIQADIRMIDSSGATNRQRDGDYDDILVRGFIDMPPSWQLRTYFHSSSTKYWNASGISHPAVDSLVDAALGAVDLESFVAACRALDRVLLWNYYQIPLDALEDTRIVYWNKFGRPELADEMYVSPFPDGWGFDEGRAARIGDPRGASGSPSSAQAH